MFRRTESARERALLRLIESQQRIIENLNDRLALAHGNPWNLPPHPLEPIPEAEYVPPEWTAAPEQEPTY